MVEAFAVHCRTGSLEKSAKYRQADVAVHCRTGSLEKDDIGSR